MRLKTRENKNRNSKFPAIVLLTIGILFLAYIGLWAAGVLSWSFDIGLCFILVCGLLMTALGVLLLQDSFQLWCERHRIITRAVRVLCAVFLLSLVTVEGLVIGDAMDNASGVKADFVLIPGAAIVQDRPSLALMHRLDKALVYITNNPSATVIVSGARGTDETHSEAEVMKQYLVANGADGSKIIKEEKATNSIGNVGFTKEIIDQMKLDHKPKVVIITNDFHMFRMKLLAHAQGIDAYGISVPIHYSVAPICYAKEYFSLIKIFLTGMKAE